MRACLSAGSAYVRNFIKTTPHLSVAKNVRARARASVLFPFVSENVMADDEVEIISVVFRARQTARKYREDFIILKVLFFPGDTHTQVVFCLALNHNWSEN